MKKLFYVIFALFAFYFFSENVEAKTIQGLVECSYNITSNSEIQRNGIPDQNTSEKEFKDHTDSEIRNANGYYLTFAYTEIVVPGWIDSANNLFVRTKWNANNAQQMTWYPSHINDEDVLAEDDFSNTGSDLGANMRNKFVANGNKCPGYVIIIEQAGGTKDKIEFSNDLNECNSSKCVGVAKLVSSYSKTISSEEKYVLSSSNDTFDSLEYYINSSGVLQGTYVYKENGTVYGPITSQARGQDETWYEDQRVNHRVGHAFAQIYSLFKTGNMDSHLEDNELYFTTKSTWYAPKYPYKFNVSYTCTPYKDIQQSFERYLSGDLDIYYCEKMNCEWGKKIKAYFEVDASGNVVESNGKIIAKDYSGYGADKISTLESELKNAEEYAGKIEAFLNKYNYARKNYDKSDYCEITKNTISTKLDKYENVSELYDKYYDGIKAAMANINNQLIAIGGTDHSEEIEEITDRIDEAMDDYKTHVIKSRAKAKAAVEGAERRTASVVTGCDTITPLMDFLQTILDYIRIIGISLAVISQIVEYIKVIYAPKAQDSMVKANSHLAIRLIAVALLFLLPALITFILALSGVDGAAESGTCGLM